MKTAEKTIQNFIAENASRLATPYYLIDEARLLENMKKIQRIQNESGAKSVLALKCFSTWAAFPYMKPYMAGTTSSSLFEARLGHDKFGKEVHAYSVAFSEEEIKAIRPIASKVIFNSVSQFKLLSPHVQGLPLGLRINPGVSHSGFDLADPARKCSRLGVTNIKELEGILDQLSGVMFHCNCENDNLEKFGAILDHITKNYDALLRKLKWVSLGGGIYFTKDGYPLDGFIQKLKTFADTYKVQVYLEPGESAITQAGLLVTKVLDVVHNEMDIAIVDAAVETHMLDLLIYRTDAKIDPAPQGPHRYTVAGRTCLAGDVFGTYNFPKKLEVGSLISFADAAGYTMVKKNWFNGVPMPSIVIRRLDGQAEVVKTFTYEDYLGYLS